MEGTRTSIRLVVIFAVGLLLSGASAIAASTQSSDRSYESRSYKQDEPLPDQPTTSPAFYAAILGELRGLVAEEVAKQRQEHADHKYWNTTPFWITLAPNVLWLLPVLLMQSLATVN
jgi:hypothetical protein